MEILRFAQDDTVWLLDCFTEPVPAKAGVRDDEAEL